MIKVNCFLPKALISTSSVNMKLLLLFLFMTLTLAQKGNCIICISQSIAMGGKLADSWIRHVARDSLVLPAANFSSLPTSPQTTVDPCLEAGTPVGTFTHANLCTFAPPRAHNYQDQSCPAH